MSRLHWMFMDVTAHQLFFQFMYCCLFNRYAHLIFFFFFFLMIRRPPRSPLSPYPTLFRSRRIRASLERHGDRFAEKVLAEGELATWRARRARWPERGIRFVATRFSAKEAFSKAIGMGMVMPMTWRSCEVIKLPSGQPAIVLHGALKEWFEAR